MGKWWTERDGVVRKLAQMWMQIWSKQAKWCKGIHIGYIILVFKLNTLRWSYFKCITITQAYSMCVRIYIDFLSITKKSNSYFFKAIIYACVYDVCWGGGAQMGSVQSEIGGQLSRVSSLFPCSRGRVSIIVSATGLLTQGRQPISLQAILISHCTSPRIMDVCYSISVFMWILEIDLRPLGLHSKCFYPQSPFDGPCNYIFTDL